MLFLFRYDATVIKTCVQQSDHRSSAIYILIYRVLNVTWRNFPFNFVAVKVITVAAVLPHPSYHSHGITARFSPFPR